MCVLTKLCFNNKTLPGGSIVLEHGFVVGGQHPLQRTGHWVAPHEVVVQCAVGIESGRDHKV